MVSYSLLLFAPHAIRQVAVQVRHLSLIPPRRFRGREIIIRMEGRHLAAVVAVDTAVPLSFGRCATSVAFSRQHLAVRVAER